MNILIVDDSRITRSIIKKTLKIAQVPTAELYEAAHGGEAIDMLHEHWIDLVFADINMPVMNGIEMVEKMNDDAMLKNIDVVIVSTEGSTTRIEQFMSKGVRGYIQKPFAPEQIKKIVDDIMEGEK
ncbi:response regulator [Candidatus Auribacterota bacterium]